MPIYSGFTHWKWWFSIIMLVYQRVKPLGFGWNIGYYHQKSDVVVGPLTVNHVSMRVRNRGSHFVDSHSFMSFFLVLTATRQRGKLPGKAIPQMTPKHSAASGLCTVRTGPLLKLAGQNLQNPNLFGMNIPKSQHMGVGKPKRLAGSNDPSFAVIARIWTPFMGRRNPDSWWVSLLGGGMLGTCIMNIVVQIDGKSISMYIYISVYPYIPIYLMVICKIPSISTLLYWLVVSNMNFIFHFIYGMSSFPLTNSHFSRWFLHHQPG